MSVICARLYYAMLRALILELGPEFGSCLYHLLVAWFRANWLTSLCFSFLHCTREMVLIPNSTRGSAVGLMRLYCRLSLPCVAKKPGITISKISFHVWLWGESAKERHWCEILLAGAEWPLGSKGGSYGQTCGQEDVSFKVASGWACWESPSRSAGLTDNESVLGGP